MQKPKTYFKIIHFRCLLQYDSRFWQKKRTDILKEWCLQVRPADRMDISHLSTWILPCLCLCLRTTKNQPCTALALAVSARLIKDVNF